jgi:hypothetical protein
LVTTTTVDPKAEVEAAYLATATARDRCNYEPESCDFAAIAVPSSPQDLLTRETIATRMTSNLRGVEGFGEVLTRIDDVTIAGDIAFVKICSLDSGVLFDVQDPDNPDDDIIFDDSIASRRVTWEMRLTDGIWLRYEGTNLEKLSGGDLCGF